MQCMFQRKLIIGQVILLIGSLTFGHVLQMTLYYFLKTKKGRGPGGGNSRYEYTLGKISASNIAISVIAAISSY